MWYHKTANPEGRDEIISEPKLVNKGDCVEMVNKYLERFHPNEKRVEQKVGAIEDVNLGQ